MTLDNLFACLGGLAAHICPISSRASVPINTKGGMAGASVCVSALFNSAELYTSQVVFFVFSKVAEPARIRSRARPG